MPQKKRSLKYITSELINNPFLPLLFISETIKIAALAGPTMEMFRMLILSIISTIIWVLSDSIEIDVDKESIVGN